MAGSLPKESVGENQPQVFTPGSAGQNRHTYRVLLYVPNLIGYGRLILLLLAFWSLPSTPSSFILFYSISITLDGFDGYAARKLHQCSLFGAWFDIILDNLSRGLLWAHLHPMLYLVSALEWTTFVCTHHLGAEWKNSLNQRDHHPPHFISCILSNNFRNPLGIWTIAGLHVLPVWLMGIKYEVFASHLWFLPQVLQPAGLIVLGVGRLLCGITEVWTIAIHVSDLLVNTSPCS
ncbi:hypothetical protein Pmani_026872 [Petrolisthes manimaculis]|uniref:CDP-diacylglycerol--inositol 3-phosphatidyltransferase n=1 Tax=Petrolisthes manimaculis TaxID=1843537 RepID=A0AAE1P5D5_9EUCA|nr:hypothetical protein Pmani_026872 [Petrolisthes manimaculis]